jgi:two-component system response regulator AlgR
VLSILIIDDEPPARARMRRLLTKVSDCRIAGEAGSAREALQKLEQQPVDVLLLDISMPGLDGMALARLLKSREEQQPVVIFCTAHSDQALEAFGVDAVDYLLKPVRVERLQSALDKARLRLRSGQESSAGEWLRSTVGGKVRLVALDTVVCLLAEDKYTTAVTTGGMAIINLSLVELENRYADAFLRVHRNSLVAKKQVRGLEKDTDGHHHVVLDGADVRPQVSRRQLPQLRQLIREMT